MTYLTRLQVAQKVEVVQVQRVERRKQSALNVLANYKSNKRAVKKANKFIVGIAQLAELINTRADGIIDRVYSPRGERLITTQQQKEMLSALQKEVMQVCRKMRLGIQGVTGARSSSMTIYDHVIAKMPHDMQSF